MVTATQVSDGELLKRHLAGDGGAFEAVLRRHAAMVLAVCRRVLGDSGEAEDAAQAAFIVLARKAGVLPGEADVGAWLHHAARCAAADALRARKARRRHEQEASAMRQPQAQTGPDSAVWGELRPKLDAALGELPAKQRRALVACYLEGRSQSEAARALGMPEGTVAVYCRRGLERLREKLGRSRDERLGAAALGALLLAEAGSGATAVPAQFLASTLSAVGHTAAVAPPVAALVEGVLGAMFRTKLKVVACVAAGLLLLAVVAPLTWRALGQDAPGIPTVQPVPPAPPPVVSVRPPTEVPAAPAVTPVVKNGPAQPAAVTGQPPAVVQFASAVLPAVKAEPAEVARQVEGNAAFALDLYAKLAADKKQAGKNLFLSPYSISSALAMTYAGARGNTAAEMKKTLRFALEDEKLHAAFASLTGGMNAGDSKTRGYELAVANALWGQKGYKFLDPFIQLNRELYGAGLNDVDFKGDTEGARQTINAWVEKQTRDKIKDLLKPGVLNDLTRLVLTNAIYFKGDWASQFDKKQTGDQDFFVGSADSIKVPTMYQSHGFRMVTGSFGSNEVEPARGEWPEPDAEKKPAPDFQAIELPYKGEELSMVVLLPGKKDGLADLEKAMTASRLAGWIAGLRGAPEAEKVLVYLPKFKVTAEFMLKDALAGLGMKDAFDPRAADFSGMNGAVHDLYISAVVHKAFVDVNEEGTEAAAATAVVMVTASAKPPPPVFRADHPFVFLIRDNRSGSVLFMGRVANPKQQ